MNKTITAAGAPAAVGPYCHAKLAGNTLYTSGQLGLIPETGTLPEGVEAQTKQALENLGTVLKAADMDYCDVVKTTVLLADIAEFAAMNAVYAEFFAEPYPARAAYQVAALPRGAKVEIEAIAVK